MAKGRMLSNEISLDPELNLISVEAQLCYVLAFTHLDRDGLIDAHPNRLWATLCPLRTELFDQMARIMDEWVRIGRVIKYACGDGRGALFFKDFRKYNLRLKYFNEAASAFPPPPGWVRSKAGLIPEDLELRERMAQNFDGRSQYRSALEAHLNGSLSRQEGDNSATSGGFVREEDQDQVQNKNDLVDGGDQIIHTTHPVRVNWGGGGGDEREQSVRVSTPSQDGQFDNWAAELASFEREILEGAAWQLGSLLNFHTDWHDYRQYLVGASDEELARLLTWIKRYCDDVQLAEGVKSLPATVRSHVRKRTSVFLTSGQKEDLVQTILACVGMEVWEEG